MNTTATQHRHVLVLEDDALLRIQLVHSLTQAGFAVTAYESVPALASAPPPDGPCVALLDMRLGEGSGLDALRLLHQRQPGLPVVFISGESQPQEIIQAMKLGALEFLLKPFHLRALLSALERGMAQEDARRARQAQQAHARTLFTRLSPREREVSRLLVDGLQTTQIAERLGLAYGTAKIHRLRVFEKLEVGCLAGLMDLLRDAGLVEVQLPLDAAVVDTAGRGATSTGLSAVDFPIDVPLPPPAATDAGPGVAG